MFGEEALWLLKRATARLLLKRSAEAEADLRRALTLERRPWVNGRIQTELGKLADLKGERKAALALYRQGKQIAKANNDPIGEKEGERWIDEVYKG